MAVRNMRVNPNTRIQQSLGFNPRGVIVDNITAYWLYFPQADQYCPPFTAGWTAPLKLNIAGSGYMEIKTPFGQIQSDVTVNVSQFVEIVWTDEEVAFSPGLPSSGGTDIDPTETNTPGVLDVLTQINATVTVPTVFPGMSQTLITGIAGRRVRLLTAEVSLNFLDLTIETIDSPVYWEIEGALGMSRVCQGLLTRDSPSDSRIYPNGLYYDVADNVVLNARTSWADNSIVVSVTYQMIV